MGVPMGRLWHSHKKIRCRTCGKLGVVAASSALSENRPMALTRNYAAIADGTQRPFSPSKSTRRNGDWAWRSSRKLARPACTVVRYAEGIPVSTTVVQPLAPRRERGDR